MLTWYERDEFLKTAKILSEPLPAIERWHFLETANRLLTLTALPNSKGHVVEELRAEVKALTIMIKEMESWRSDNAG